MADLQTNARADVIAKPLFRETSVYSEDYYTKFNRVLNEISKMCDADQSDAYGYLVSRYEELITVLSKTPSNDIIAAVSFLNILTWPIFHMTSAQKKKYLHNKTYKNFNIDLHFFVSLRKENYTNYYIHGNEMNIVGVDTFEFKKSKLSSFVLSKPNGMKWHYNSKYALKSVTFIDGVTVDMDLTEEK